jgi:multidrug efflux system outer membrane protein
VIIDLKVWPISIGLPGTRLSFSAPNPSMMTVLGNRGVAIAAFFSTIMLTGAALGTLVDWPSRIWSVGPSIHVPIFEGGRNRANLAATEARYDSPSPRIVAQS